MPTTPNALGHGWRRLEEYREPERTLLDLETIIYGPAAARTLVDFLQQPCERAPRPEAICDALRQILFEGSASLTPNEALARAAGIDNAPHGAAMYARIVLQHAIYFGTVALQVGPSGPIFVVLHPGIVHFPRYGAVADARTAVVIGRGPGLPALLKRESKKRAASSMLRRGELLALLVRLRDRVDTDAAVLLQLTSPDHPPAQTMGDFVRELPGFLDAMPTWRLGELAMVLHHMPRRTQPAHQTEDTSSPEELKDFFL